MYSDIEYYDHLEYDPTNSGYHTTCFNGTYVYNNISECNGYGWWHLQLEWRIHPYDRCKHI